MQKHRTRELASWMLSQLNLGEDIWIGSGRTDRTPRYICQQSSKVVVGISTIPLFPHSILLFSNGKILRKSSMAFPARGSGCFIQHYNHRVPRSAPPWNSRPIFRIVSSWVIVFKHAWSVLASTLLVQMHAVPPSYPNQLISSRKLCHHQFFTHSVSSSVTTDERRMTGQPLVKLSICHCLWRALAHKNSSDPQPRPSSLGANGNPIEIQAKAISDWTSLKPQDAWPPRAIQWTGHRTFVRWRIHSPFLSRWSCIFIILIGI